MWWTVVKEALGWVQFVGGLLFALGVYLYKRRIEDLKQENQVLGSRSLKTLLEDAVKRVADVESRMSHGETHLSDLADCVQKLIGQVGILQLQVQEINTARGWLFERVTELLRRK